jgi:hypothetical protein
MPFNEITAQRIRESLLEQNADFTEKKMFSGICFMVDDKMCCGTHIDKNTGEDFLLCRVGPEAYASCLTKKHVVPMNFTGKSMNGYVFVTGKGLSNKKDLDYWIGLCLAYNPKAKSSKK